MSELHDAVDELLVHIGERDLGPELRKRIERVRKALEQGRQPLPHDMESPYAGL